MAIQAAIGQGQAMDGREAAAQATHRALERLGREPIALAIVVASDQYLIQQVVNGVATLVGDTPLFGFSTSAELTAGGYSQRSVVVALLSGESLQAHADWWPGFSEDSRTTAQKVAQAYRLSQANGLLLLAADGLSGDGSQFCASLPPGDYRSVGCLAGGEIRRHRTYQIGGRQAGMGGIASAVLNGNLIVSSGLAHGWKAIGPSFRVTKCRGPWLRSLNDQPAAEAYTRMMGYTAREWSFPPLNELVRLYPLGVETQPQSPLLVYSPIRMETDGSLRMQTSLPEGSLARFLIGSSVDCQQAAEQAARQALAGLGAARPVLALALVDVSWQMLMETQPGLEVQALRRVLGDQIPLVGGYTFGQIASTDAGTPALYSQHLQVVILGEAPA